MKTRLFLFIILLESPYVFSQDELGIPKLKPVNDYWSIGYYASGNFSFANLYNNGDVIQPGYGAIVEITYNDSKRDLLLMFGANYITSSRDNEHFNVYELTLGPRFKLLNFEGLFAEFTLGGLLVHQIRKSSWYDNFYYDNYTEPFFNFAATAAVGAKVKINNNNNFMFKLRWLSAISLEKDFLNYFSVNTGFTFNNKKSTLNKKNKPSYYGIMLLGGINNPGMFTEKNYTWGWNGAIELFYKFYPKAEFWLNGTYNDIKIIGRNEYNKKIMTSVTAGSRFFISENPATAFIEIGTGYYEYEENNSLYSDFNYTSEAPGVNLGTGAKLAIEKNFDFILKSSLNLLLSGKYDNAPNYLSLQGGLRFNL